MEETENGRKEGERRERRSQDEFGKMKEEDADQ